MQGRNGYRKGDKSSRARAFLFVLFTSGNQNEILKENPLDPRIFIGITSGAPQLRVN